MNAPNQVPCESRIREIRTSGLRRERERGGHWLCLSFRASLSTLLVGSDLMKRAPFRGLGAILFKEFIIVWRDPMTLFFMFFPPLVEMIAFGYALDNDVKHMGLVILNQDRTVESRQFLDRFVNTETFRIVGEVDDINTLASEIRKGN